MLTKLQSEDYKKYCLANFRTNKILGIKTPKKSNTSHQLNYRGSKGTKNGGLIHGLVAKELLVKLNQLEPQMQHFMIRVNLL